MFNKLFPLLTLLALASALMAQDSAINGRITDPSGLAVQNAAVEIENQATGIKTQARTNADGRYLSPPAMSGTYSVRVQAAGFDVAWVRDIRLEVGGARIVDVQLQAASLKQEVTVSAAEPQITVDRADRGNVIESEFVQNVPLNVRNPLQLINFAQAVTPVAPGLSGTNDTAQPYTNAFSLNGGKVGTTEILLDGGANTTAYLGEAAAVPQVDSIREFRVLTTAYAPEYGRTSGGVVVFASQSGTNALHGSVFEYLRNDVLDANGFNADRAGQAKNHLERNQFGFAAGGPVAIPKLYNGHNRTFFFASYEGLRQIAAGSFTGTVPTALERQGNFSQTRDTNGNLIVIYDPHTTQLDPNRAPGTTQYIRTPFAGNIIPSNLLNTVGLNILKNYPMPDQAGQGQSSTNNFFSNAPSTSNQDRFDAKVDHTFNDHHSVFFRYDWFRNQNNSTNEYGNGLSPELGNNRIPGINWMAHHTWSINQSLIFEEHLSYGHSESSRQSPSLGFQPTSLGFDPSVTAGLNAVDFPLVIPSRLSAIGTQVIAIDNKSSVWQYGGAGTWLRGNHTLKFGVDYRYYPITFFTPQQPTVTALSNFSGGPNPQAAAAASGSGAADLLLGAATVTSGIVPQFNYAHSYFGAFAQDEFRVSPKLTLTYGLRYTLELPDHEDKNQYVYINLNSPSPLSVPGLGQLKGGVGFVNGNIQHAQLNNWDPRLGLAYKLDDKTVLRAGFGIFHHPSPTLTNASYGYSAVTTSNPVLADGVTPQFNLANPFPQGLTQPAGNSLGLSTNLGLSIAAPPLNQSIPYSAQWSADLQRQVSFGIVATLGYAANTGNHLISPVNVNQIPDSDLSQGTALLAQVPNPFYGIITNPTSPLSAKTVQAGQLLRPYPQFQNVTLNGASVGHSTYQSMQLALERRFSQGLALLFAYTHSKAIDNVGEVYNWGAGLQNGFQNNNCYSCDRSVSDTDIPDVIRLSAQYELPFGRRKQFVNHGWLSQIAGGWTMGGFFTWDDGTAVSLQSPNNSNSFGGGVSTERPNVTGVSPLEPGGPQIVNNGLYFNPAAFSQTPSFQFGNAPRLLSNVRNPGHHNVDVLVSKHFVLTERIALDFRGELFNAFNNVVFGGPNTNIASSSFGHIFLTQVNQPRQIQLGLRLNF